MSKKCVAYIRVSTDRQDYNNQMPDIEALAKQYGLVIGEVYAESASAWKNGHQKEFAKLRLEAAKGNISTLIVWAYDRITRGGSGALISVLDYLSQCGVNVLSVQQPDTNFDTSTPFGEAMQKIMISLYGAIAKQESNLRSERTKAGLIAAKKRGAKLGRPAGSKDKRKRQKRAG